ncbi:fibronectin type III domain-containing protein [Candidatus Saccharibacteria bacterium]|nr:fibronectin type III domain-containing protein [Candidatus Saccharibacteria bacterium]
MKQKFHFQHHKAEALRTRRRFAFMNAALFMVAAVIIGGHYVASHGATTTYGSIDGVKIDTSGVGDYGGSTTGPYNTANVTIVAAGSATGRSSTAEPFYFTQLVAPAAGQQYTISVSPTVVGNYHLKGYTYEDGTAVGWNPQTSNFHASSSFTFNLVANHIFHMRWIYQYVAPPTPAPTPVKTPTPVVKTPTPGQPTPKPGTGGSSAIPAATPAPVPDTQAPTAPTAFQALAASNNALVNLSWTAATDNVGVASYHIERTLDQTKWSVVADQSELTFQDDTAAFGVHYYYRISAFDAAGNQSPYATADATTTAFAGSSTSTPQTFTSDDKVATVSIPSDAFDTDTDCTVVTSQTAVSPGKNVIVAGPYEVLCKDSSGNAEVATKQPLTWTYAIKAKMSGFKNPVGITLSDNASATTATKSTYNSKTGGFTFTSATLGSTAVLASVNPGLPVSLIVFGFLFLLIAAAVVIFFLRRGQKRDYNEYIRSKYYDL